MEKDGYKGFCGHCQDQPCSCEPRINKADYLDALAFVLRALDNEQDDEARKHLKVIQEALGYVVVHCFGGKA